jgi:hypothetical protein
VRKSQRRSSSKETIKLGAKKADRESYRYIAPGFVEPAELRDWCRARRDKKLYGMQTEAAEWAISIIPEKSKMPKEIQDEEIASIKKRIADLRKTQKATPGKFVAIDIICPYLQKATI